MIARLCERSADVPVAELERLLPATIDSASHRIDPWLVAAAAHAGSTTCRRGPRDPPPRRLRLGRRAAARHARAHRGRAAARAVAGAGPHRRGAARPGRQRPEPTRWDLDLTSRPARTADRIAEHVRVGAHLAEALGREVERVVGDRGGRRAAAARLPGAHRARRPARLRRARACWPPTPATLGLDAGRLAGLARAARGARRLRRPARRRGRPPRRRGPRRGRRRGDGRRRRAGPAAGARPAAARRAGPGGGDRGRAASCRDVAPPAARGRADASPGRARRRGRRRRSSRQQVGARGRHGRVGAAASAGDR